MLLNIREANKFKQDIRRIGRQGHDLSLLETTIKTPVAEKPLAQKYKDHKLIGDWKGYRECHIKPDWLLIYRVADKELELLRTGSHAEIFYM